LLAANTHGPRSPASSIPNAPRRNSTLRFMKKPPPMRMKKRDARRNT